MPAKFHPSFSFSTQPPKKSKKEKKKKKDKKKKSSRSEAASVDGDEMTYMTADTEDVGGGDEEIVDELRKK